MRQALVEFTNFGGRRPLIGARIVDVAPSDFCVRWGGGSIAGDSASFVSM